MPTQEWRFADEDLIRAVCRLNRRKEFPLSVVLWASAHDWFRFPAADSHGYRGVTVEETTIHPDNTVTTHFLTILDPVELKNWAGY